MSGWTPESLAAHKARLEIIEKLGWGPSSIAGPDWIVERVKREKRELEVRLRQLEQRVSPATEPCSCPEFCTYHARANFEALKLDISELRSHLKYVSVIAERLGPKASEVHREEALHLLEGTVKEARELLKRTDKRVVPVPNDEYPNKCNRHDDCRKASADWRANHPGKDFPVDFCCSDEGCEDCFGS